MKKPAKQRATMTLNLPKAEMKALDALAKKQVKTKTTVVREALTAHIAASMEKRAA